jgi:predicted RNase H-like nuclease (RuvC/YqgF family)
MDEAQVRALIDEALEGVASKDEVTAAVNKAVSGFASRNTRDLDKRISELKDSLTQSPNQEGDGGDLDSTPESKRAMQKIQELEQKIKEKEEQTERIQKENTLQEAINSVDAINKSALVKILKSDLQFVKDGDKYYIDNGDDAPLTPQEAVKAYLASDEGKAFLPAPTAKGSGSTETSPSKSPTNKAVVQGLAGVFQRSMNTQ